MIAPRTRPRPDPSASHRAIRAASRAAYADLAPLIARLRGEGVSYAMIARWLNEGGRRTRGGRTFEPNTIRRIHLRSSIPADTCDQFAPQ
ncbi:recombinase family protein [Tundrisphaera sp. TA3]|uniref:recombinase family protein n=1 Tax=Tundrisphaera sp. TA3 TaxID=3435775 RepID=UPI003EB876C9